MPRIVTFAEALRRAMKGHRVDSTAAAVGIDPNTLTELRVGRTKPMLATAAALADHLVAPHLTEIAIAERTRDCVICGAPFVDDSRGGYRRRYCGDRCVKTAHARRVRGAKVNLMDRRVRVAENRLAVYQQAVDEMCRGCVLGEPYCPDAGCALRPVSPIPLARSDRRAA